MYYFSLVFPHRAGQETSMHLQDLKISNKCVKIRLYKTNTNSHKALLFIEKWCKYKYVYKYKYDYIHSQVSFKNVQNKIKLL